MPGALGGYPSGNGYRICPGTRVDQECLIGTAFHAAQIHAARANGDSIRPLTPHHGKPSKGGEGTHVNRDGVCSIGGDSRKGATEDINCISRMDCRDGQRIPATCYGGVQIADGPGGHLHGHNHLIVCHTHQKGRGGERVHELIGANTWRRFRTDIPPLI